MNEQRPDETFERNGLALRHMQAASWWIVGELVRHHPELRFHLPAGQPLVQGLSRPLILSDPSSRFGRAVILDPWTGIHFHPHVTGFMQWTDVLATQEPIDSIRWIETELGLDFVPKAPRSGSAVLVYRSISTVLAMVINHRLEWMVESVRLPFGGVARDGNWPLLRDREQFERARAAAWHVPDGRLGWVLLKDDNPVALFDASGHVVTDEATYNVVSVHGRTGRKLTVTVARMLAPVLP